MPPGPAGRPDPVCTLTVIDQAQIPRNARYDIPSAAPSKPAGPGGKPAPVVARVYSDQNAIGERAKPAAAMATVLAGVEDSESATKTLLLALEVRPAMDVPNKSGEEKANLEPGHLKIGEVVHIIMASILYLVLKMLARGCTQPILRCSAILSNATTRTRML